MSLPVILTPEEVETVFEASQAIASIYHRVRREEWLATRSERDPTTTLLSFAWTTLSRVNAYQAQLRPASALTADELDDDSGARHEQMQDRDEALARERDMQ